jgi:arylformamidase
MSDNDWIDVSVTLKSGMLHWPGDPPVVIERVRDMDRGDTVNLSRITMGAHSGTHVDAPVHFLKGAPGIDRLPLHPLVGKARVIGITANESIREKDLAGQNIEKGERILLRTRNSLKQILRKDAFDEEFIFLEEDAALFLAARGILALGVDYLSVGGYRKNGSAVHRILLGAGIFIIEGLDLAGVLPGRYEMFCLPLKILDADGAPARTILQKSRGIDHESLKPDVSEYRTP